jgi:hypothetical protein
MGVTTPRGKRTHRVRTFRRRQTQGYGDHRAGEHFLVDTVEVVNTRLLERHDDGFEVSQPCAVIAATSKAAGRSWQVQVRAMAYVSNASA